MVLVSDDVRETYENAAAGSTIALNKVLAYYVWIPRYKYKIFTDIENLVDNGSIDISNYQNKASEIDIVFEDKETTKSSGSTKGSYLTHPAFTFGSEELNGIWVGKFETTGTAASPTILPGDTSLKSQNVSMQFLTSQKLNYGTNKESNDRVCATILPRILGEHCATVKEAVDYIKTLNVYTPNREGLAWNFCFIMADATGVSEKVSES